MKIWFSYLLRHLVKNFLTLSILFFLIYSIVDLAIHGVRFFSHGSLEWADMAIYYVYDFLGHFEFFLPFTFLLTVLKVLLDLNSHHEWVALQMAGLSQKKLLSPFFIFALFLTLASYANQEWIIPSSQESAETFRTEHSKNKNQKKTYVHSVNLHDKTELVYQSFQASSQELQDVFWVKNSKDIWHMKSLKIDPAGIKASKGSFVDHFQRNKENLLEKTESFASKDFPQITIAPHAHLQMFIPFENRPLSTLLQQSLKPYSEKPIVLTHLHYKLATPLLSFLILIAVSPIALKFKRNKASFLIVAGSLAVFIGFMTVLQGMLILGENQVLPGYLAVWSPLILIAFICTPYFAKTR